MVLGIAACTPSQTGQNTQTTSQNNAPQTNEQTAQEQEQETPETNEDSVQPSPQEESGITSTELSAHNTQADCWVAYKGKVYDVTDWLKKHPGGANTIAQHCGTSTQFEEAFEKQHRTSKVNTLEKEGIYKGELI